MINDPLQIAALSIIAIFFCAAYFGIGRERGFLAQIAVIAPNVLTSIGIFFTFVGILIALQNFDVNSINDAVPNLLSGLQLAFLSSVAGLFASVLFRLFTALGNRDKYAAEIGLDDVHDQLKALNKSTILVLDALIGVDDKSLSTQLFKLRNEINNMAVELSPNLIHSNLKSMGDNIVSVREALIGEGDASLSTQFTKLRVDFQDFAKKMTEDGTQALVKALESVIKDFNEKITEQFGENFQQLNEAVGALLEWQEEYKVQVKELTNAFEIASSAIQAIETSSAKIPEHMLEVETAFKATNSRVSELYEVIGSLSDMRQAANNALPELQHSIKTMTTGIGESIKQQLSVVDDQIDDYRQLTDELTNIINATLGKIEQNFNIHMETYNKVLNNLDEGADRVLVSVNEITTNIQKTIDIFASKQDEVSNEIKAKIDKSLADNVEVMEKGISELDKSMNEELEKALGIMAKNLTSITEKFVDVYEKNAKSIVELTQSISNDKTTN
ncbi:MAG: hypothetical protein OXC91_12355 [Rhodobacteraceae bacterium]|nr:hypothetical protein [Paracoccaceae bacterium]